MKKIAIALTTASLVMAMPAFAHHSYAMFDMMTTVDVKGTVKEFHYTNPHSWIVLLSEDASGKTQELTAEANGPGYLVRNGWKRTSIEPGDVVTLSMHPLRDGSPGGSLVSVKFADGHVLGTLPPGLPELPPSGAPSPGAPSPGAAPPDAQAPAKPQ